MDDLLALRREFPILERTTYLINNSLGAMPRGVHDELAAFAGQWEQRGVRAVGRDLEIVRPALPRRFRAGPGAGPQAALPALRRPAPLRSWTMAALPWLASSIG